MPASHAFPAIRRGDTKTLAVFLVRKGIATLARTPLLQFGDVAIWTLTPPGGQPKDTVGGVDLAAGKVSLPFTAQQTRDMPLGVTTGHLRVTDTDGGVTTHLGFTLPFTD